MKINQIKVGAILSYLSMGLSTAISLIYTPIMIARLGDSEYGVYNLVLPIISYLNLLSFGLGSAYVRYYSRSKVANDKKGMARINDMFLTTYSVLGALVLLFGNTQYVQDLMNGQNVLLFICSFVGLNAVMEMLASTLVTGALCTALDRARLMRR